RARMPYRMQFACFMLDGLLWIIFAFVVIYYTFEQTWLAYDNFAIVGGTDNVMEWWFYLATPLAWSLIIIRVIQNLIQDYQRYQRREPFVLQASLMD
ncbi:MAG: TRAP transporter small permease, partial [Gammaproteobacteria bacterium]|nr:TRAP transporter small permease [Gammaproteobacteria bacterium]